jgi:hypothetical protein
LSEENIEHSLRKIGGGETLTPGKIMTINTVPTIHIEHNKNFKARKKRQNSTLKQTIIRQFILQLSEHGLTGLLTVNFFNDAFSLVSTLKYPNAASVLPN